MEREECEKRCLFPGTSQGIVSSKGLLARKHVYVLDLAPFLTGCNFSMNHARGKEGRMEEERQERVVVLGPRLPLKINWLPN